MNATAAKFALLFLTVLISAGCSFAPITPRVDAASIGKNNVKLETNISPANYLTVIYGAGEDLDLGVEVEQLFMTTAWARYSFINNPQGFSFAGNGAVFVGDGENRSNGWYAGLLMSNQFDPDIRWTAGVRYANLDYEYGLEEESDWFSYSLDFDNPDDAAQNVQLDVNISWRVKPHFELALGAACQLLLSNNDPDNRDERCFPVIGFSFYRQ